MYNGDNNRPNDLQALSGQKLPDSQAKSLIVSLHTARARACIQAAAGASTSMCLKQLIGGAIDLQMSRYRRLNVFTHRMITLEDYVLGHDM